MEVLIADNKSARQYEIYVYMSGGAKGYYRRGEKWIEQPPGSYAEPFLKLDYDLYNAIMRAALAPTPTDDELRDCRQIRDRLLGMVESEWQSRQLEKA